MRLFKVLGTASFVALAITMIVGVCSASAVTFCKENKSPCPEGQRYKAGTIIKAHSPKAVLKSSFTVACESDLVDELTEESGNPLTSKMTKLTFTKCSGCESTVDTGIPYTSLTHISILFGAFLLHNTTSGEPPGVRETGCAMGIECVYVVSENESTAHFQIENTAPNTIRTGEGESKIIKLERIGGSALCGINATWEATYTVSAPESGKIFVVKSP